MVDLPAYGIQYARRFNFARIATQAPQILKAIRKEQQWLQAFVKTNPVEIIVSDNRYGLHHEACHNIFITHQLQPALPQSLSFGQPATQKVFAGLINRFDECWIPDWPQDELSLAGKLSRGNPFIRIPQHYIGRLSRFKNTGTSPDESFDLAMLSGPEPQRSLLENLIISASGKLEFPLKLLRGLPGAQPVAQNPPGMEVISHLGKNDMAQLIRNARFVICRSGYSSLMDMSVFGKKCILIPTPGQTEQEYLAHRENKLRRALIYTQREFDLAEAIREAQQFDFECTMNTGNTLLPQRIESLTTTLGREKYNGN